MGFLAIIPFSHPDDSVFDYLNDISEAASTLTFLIQIVVLGRDINKKVRIKLLSHMTHVAEAFVALELLLMVMCVIKLCDRRLQAEWLNATNDALQGFALWFILVSRFIYIGMARGIKKMLEIKKTEMLLYFLFSTNEYPFLALEASTQLSWQPVQGLWYRLTLLLCILHTIKDKIRSASSRNMKTGLTTNKSHATVTKHSGGPTERDTPPRRVSAHGVRKRSAKVASASIASKAPSTRNISKIGLSMRSILPHGR